MGSRQALLGSLIAGLVVACSPGVGSTVGSSNNNDGGGGSDGAGNNGSTGSFQLSGGSSSSGVVSNCTDPECVGASPQGDCDGTLSIDSGDAMDGARAMGLCKVAEGSSWGVKSAEWVRSDGQPLSGNLADGKGILNGLGPVSPREGAKVLALSSGSARGPNDPGYQSVGGYWKDQTAHGSPPGYPKESPACPGSVTGEPYDSAGLKVVIKTPIDAKSFSFNLDFYTYEYPNYICDTYNDFFVAMMSPTPSGLPDGNISFDPDGNTISVNAGFLDVCTPGNHGGKNFSCTQGTAELMGTGFDEQIALDFKTFEETLGSAATGWLETKAPIDSPGSDITLHFAIWDSGDGVLDSTVLIDNFKFESDGTTTGTQPIPQ